MKSYDNAPISGNKPRATIHQIWWLVEELIQNWKIHSKAHKCRSSNLIFWQLRWSVFMSLTLETISWYQFFGLLEASLVAFPVSRLVDNPPALVDHLTHPANFVTFYA
jgi:hypothetical protein